jgi:hypothetical protein
MEVVGQGHALPALSPGKRPSTHCMRLGEPQGRYGEVRNISPPPGFNPRTFQAVASCYTDYATLDPTMQKDHKESV